MLSTLVSTLPPRMPLKNPSRLPVPFIDGGNPLKPGYGLLAAWTSIYQVKLPAKILFLHVEPSFFLSSDIVSTAVLALDFRLTERGEMLDDLAGFHAAGLRDAQGGGVHLILELLDHEIFAVHGAA